MAAPRNSPIEEYEEMASRYFPPEPPPPSPSSNSVVAYLRSYQSMESPQFQQHEDMVNSIPFLDNDYEMLLLWQQEQQEQPPPPPPLSPSSNSMVAYLGSDNSMESPSQFQQHEDIVDPMPVFDDNFMRQQLQNLQLRLQERFPEWHSQSRLTKPPHHLVPRLMCLLMKLQQRPLSLRQLVLQLLRLQKLHLYLRELFQQQQQLWLKLPRLLMVMVMGLLSQLLKPQQSRRDTGNTGTFNTAEEAASAPRGREAYRLREMKARLNFPEREGVSKNRAEPTAARIMEIPSLPAQHEDSVFGCREAMGYDEIEATWEDEMAEGGLNSRRLGKGKRKIKTSGGERETKKSGVRIAIPLGAILQTKGMKLKDAAMNLNVSRSTFKRVCREFNISRWPPCDINMLISNSLTADTPMDVDQEKIPQLNSNMLPPNQASASGDTNSVTVKARNEKGIIIKFRLSSPWRKVELEQQIERRLELEAGTYHIMYKDEENEMILIACDDDLEEYISTSISMGTNPVKVFLGLK